jgi:hypothetical protein
MAAFATFVACETRAYTKVADMTWVNAHAARKQDGTLCVRVQRKMSPTSSLTRQYGEWIEITDDGTV